MTLDPAPARLAGGLLLLSLLLAAPLAAQEHRHEVAPADDEAPGLRVRRVLTPPPGFKGTVTYDADSGRLFLVSHGPPANTRGRSRLYELEPAGGKVLRQAILPFVGELPSPVLVDGVLYQAVHHESKLFRIDVRPGPDFGKVLGELALPTLVDLDVSSRDDVYRFPFVSFRGVSRTPEGELLLHAQELGDLVTVDRTTGRFTRRVPTLKGLAGIAAVPGPRGEPLVLANSDPAQAEFESEVRRFMFRAAHDGPPAPRYGARDVLWVLLDGGSGEVLASAESRDSRAEAGAIALLRREDVAGTPYGRYVFLTTGPEGLLEMEWTPGGDADVAAIRSWAAPRRPSPEARKTWVYGDPNKGAEPR